MKDFIKDIYEGARTFMVGMKVTARYVKDNTIDENLRRDGDVDIRPNTVAYDGSVEKALEVEVADRFRGHLHCDVERCIVCMACSKACPIDCFWIEGEKTTTAKQRPSRFDIDILKCMYCGLCVTACPTGCLTMTKEWWGAQQAGTSDAEGGRRNMHGLLREYGVGFYSPEEKRGVETERALKAAEKKQKAAEAAAKKAAAKKAAEAKQAEVAEGPGGGTPDASLREPEQKAEASEPKAAPQPPPKASETDNSAP